MLSAAIILFREIIEAVMLITIFLSLSPTLPHRRRFIAGGVSLGLIGSALVAFMAARLIDSFQGTGHELLEIGLLLSMASLIGWTLWWMKGRASSTNSPKPLQSSRYPQWTLLCMSGVAIMREGSEIVLFLSGLFMTGDVSWNELLLGSSFGIAGALLIALALYHGLVRLRPRYLFLLTNGLLICVAASMLAKAVDMLVTIDLLPLPSSALSFPLMSGSSPALLSALIGSPSLLQCLVFLASAGFLWTLTLPTHRMKSTHSMV